MFDLTNRVVVVTGAGPNIGQAVGRILAKAGASIVCNDLDGRIADKTAEAVRAEGGKAIAAAGDVSVLSDVRAVFDAGEKAFGFVDILVNNSALSVRGSLLDLPPEKWQRCIDVTLGGVFMCSKVFAERAVAQKRGGVIVNVASTSGHRGRANAIAYCAAKGGVLNLTRAMAVELAPHRIRVISVSPTKTGVPLAPELRARGHTFDEIPLGRVGKPEDLAYAILFMVSDQAEFITGEDLRVDGGALATWSANT